MIEVLEFIFSSPFVFLGVWILIGAIGEAVAGIVRPGGSRKAKGTDWAGIVRAVNELNTAHFWLIAALAGIYLLSRVAIIMASHYFGG